MKEFKRIISLAMVLILCVSLLPMNQNLIKAEAQLDDSTKLKNIILRVYDGKEWTNADYTPEFDPNNRTYIIKLDIKYKKVQFFFEKANDNQVIEAKDHNKCPLRDSNYTEEYSLRPEDNLFSFFVKASNGSKDREYFFKVVKGLKNNAHEVKTSDGDYRDLPRAFKGDIVKLKGQTSYGGKVFDRWIADTHNVELESPDRILNEFIMPDSKVKFIAQFKDGSDDGSKLRYIIVHAMKDNVWETFYDAVITGVRSKDTMKFVSYELEVISTPDRRSLFNIQTPQAFRKNIILDGYKEFFSENFFVTDDSSIVENLGIKVKLVEGEYSNIKITTMEDVFYARELLERGI